MLKRIDKKLLTTLCSKFWYIKTNATVRRQSLPHFIAIWEEIDGWMVQDNHYNLLFEIDI